MELPLLPADPRHVLHRVGHRNRLHPALRHTAPLTRLVPSFKNMSASVVAPATPDVWETWHTNATAAATAQERLAIHYGRCSTALSVMVSVLNAATVAVVSSDSSWPARIVSASLAGLAACLSAAALVLKWSDRSARHRASAAQWSSIALDIQLAARSTSSDPAPLGARIKQLTHDAPTAATGLADNLRRAQHA